MTRTLSLIILLCLSVVSSTVYSKEIHGTQYFRNPKFKAIRASGKWGFIFLDTKHSTRQKDLIKHEFINALINRLGATNRGVEQIELPDNLRQEVFDTLKPVESNHIEFSTELTQFLTQLCRTNSYRRILVIRNWNINSKFLQDPLFHQSSIQTNPMTPPLGYSVSSIKKFVFDGALLDSKGTPLFFGRVYSSNMDATDNDNSSKDCVVNAVFRYFDLLSGTILPRYMGKPPKKK